jgi:hypothetical protein
MIEAAHDLCYPFFMVESSPSHSRQNRAAREAAALRANLLKRKQQAGARQAQPPETTPENTEEETQAKENE